MNPQLKAILIQLKHQEAAFKNQLSEISEEASQKVPHSGLNSIKWVAGHTLNTRLVILFRLIGQPLDEKFAACFGRGSSGQVDDSFPTLAQIIEKWDRVAPQVIAAIESKTEAEWTQAPPLQFPISDQTLLGFVTYLVHHEAFHIGQISILKKLI